jgi:predicted nucleotidyltransferase
MVDERVLQQAVKRIVAAARPSRVILFGSHGRGDADAGSDLDLMVIKPQVPDRYAEMIRLHEAVGGIGVGVDVLVYSEAEVEKRRDWCTSPVYWALREGKVLYEAAASGSLACVAAGGPGCQGV